MFLIILAIVSIVVAFGLQSSVKTKPASRIVKVVAVILLLVGVVSSSIVQIEAGEVGVPSVFGKVNDQILNSGLHFINPFAVVRKFDVRTENYTMSGVMDEGATSGDDAIRVFEARNLFPLSLERSNCQTFLEKVRQLL